MMLIRVQLFGHEIVAVLCGLVWGLGSTSAIVDGDVTYIFTGWGFAIVAAGTFLGEVGNF